MVKAISLALAGAMGVAGILIAAAGAHGGGGELARIAADFLLIHAVAVMGLGGREANASRGSLALLIGAALLVVGAIVFSGDLALAGLAGLRPFPAAAPIGGFCLIAGWLSVVIAGCAALWGDGGKRP